MTAQGPGDGLQPIDRDAPIFVISVAAHLAGMHPQTLRTYDRMGLVSPRRTRGRGRRYSPRDVAKLRLVQRLSKEEGVNLEGIRRILQMQRELEDLREEVDALQAEVELYRERAQQVRPHDGVRFFTAGEDGVHIARLRQERRARRRPPELYG